MRELLLCRGFPRLPGGVYSGAVSAEPSAWRQSGSRGSLLGAFSQLRAEAESPLTARTERAPGPPPARQLPVQPRCRCPEPVPKVGSDSLAASGDATFARRLPRRHPGAALGGCTARAVKPAQNGEFRAFRALPRCPSPAGCPWARAKAPRAGGALEGSCPTEEQPDPRRAPHLHLPGTGGGGGLSQLPPSGSRGTGTLCRGSAALGGRRK